MDMLKRLMAMNKGHKMRFWSDDQNRLIYTQTTVQGVSVAQVARRFAMNANLIHDCLKDPRFAPEPAINVVVDTAQAFCPLRSLAQSLFPVSMRPLSWTWRFRLTAWASRCKLDKGF